MRIGIDATSWTNWRGFGRFTRSIVRALVDVDHENEYVLFFDGTHARADGVPADASAIVVRTAAAQSEAISVDGRRSVRDMLRMTRAVAREPLDVFFCPSIDGYFPLTGKAARVVMIHDVIPETMGATMLPGRRSRWRRAIKVRTALAQAHVVATGSDFIRAQLGPVFGLDPDRVAVIPYGVSDAFYPPTSREEAERQVFERHGVRAPYFLHVGGFGPNKNIPTLLDSFAALLADNADVPATLVFVGRRDQDAVYEEAQAIDRRLSSAGLSERVVFLGLQPDEALVTLYQAARALVLPSRVEGFGLPATEAVSCGTPAIVTRISPLPETLGPAAIVVDPDDQHGLTRALRRALTDDTLRSHTQAYREQFRWTRSAEAALASFKRASIRRS